MRLDEGTEWWYGDRSIDPRAGEFRRLYELVEARLERWRYPGQTAIDLGAGEGKITSILRKKGFEVTAVDADLKVLERIEKRFPDVDVIHSDIRNLELARWHSRFDLATMIYTAQHIPIQDLRKTLSTIRGFADRLIVEFSNESSLYRQWVNLRGFTEEPAVYGVPPRIVEMVMRQAGWHIDYERGLGLLMPMSIKAGYRWPVVPSWAVRGARRFERFFPRHCDKYYVEAS